MPAALTWAPQGTSTDFYANTNWYLTGTSTRPSAGPMAGDDVTFDGSVSSANCTDLGVLQIPVGGGGGTNAMGGATTLGSGSTTTGLHSLNLITNYSGTVTLIAPVTTAIFNLTAGASGAIAQHGQRVLIAL